MAFSPALKPLAWLSLFFFLVACGGTCIYSEYIIAGTEDDGLYGIPENSGIIFSISNDLEAELYFEKDTAEPVLEITVEVAAKDSADPSYTVLQCRNIHAEYSDSFPAEWRRGKNTALLSAVPDSVTSFYSLGIYYFNFEPPDSIPQQLLRVTLRIVVEKQGKRQEYAHTVEFGMKDVERSCGGGCNSVRLGKITCERLPGEGYSAPCLFSKAAIEVQFD